MMNHQKANGYVSARCEAASAQYQQRTRWVSLLGVLMTLLMLAGCADMSDTQRRTGTGAAVGAAGGAVVGAIAGDTALGAVVGTAAGAAGGYLYDKHEKSKEEAYEQGRRDAEAQ
jgi:hypothetical protein